MTTAKDSARKAGLLPIDKTTYRSKIGFDDHDNGTLKAAGARPSLPPDNVFPLSIVRRDSSKSLRFLWFPGGIRERKVRHCGSMEIVVYIFSPLVY